MYGQRELPGNVPGDGCCLSVRFVLGRTVSAGVADFPNLTAVCLQSTYGSDEVRAGE